MMNFVFGLFEVQNSKDQNFVVHSITNEEGLEVQAPLNLTQSDTLNLLNSVAGFVVKQVTLMFVELELTQFF